MSDAIKKKYEDITPQEWQDYCWAYDPYEDVCIRTYKRVAPPNDGYEYQEVTAIEDKEQKWIRGLKKGEE